MLKLNLILNNLVSSLDHAIQGDTLVAPYHKSDDKQSLRQFDFVVSNPPFKMDFSDTREQVAAMPVRFWAGVPKIPSKKKEAMSIYTCFIQHVINSLKDTGTGAIAVPTGFISAGNGIESKILRKIIDDQIVYGCVSMPSNVFANTGTNVSVLFFDNSKNHKEVILIDASKLGEDYQDNGLKKKRIRNDEIDKIIRTFNNREKVEGFSSVVNYEKLKDRYSLAAGQYFEVKIEHSNISKEEFYSIINKGKNEIIRLNIENEKLHKDLISNLEKISYDEKI